MSDRDDAMDLTGMTSLLRALLESTHASTAIDLVYREIARHHPVEGGQWYRFDPETAQLLRSQILGNPKAIPRPAVIPMSAAASNSVLQAAHTRTIVISHSESSESTSDTSPALPQDRTVVDIPIMGHHTLHGVLEIVFRGHRSVSREEMAELRAYSILLGITLDRLESESIRQRYLRLIRRLPVGYFRTTLDGRVTDANPALARMLGYADETALRSARATEWPFFPGDAGVLGRWAMQAGETTPQLFQIRRPDGESAWLMGRIFPVPDASGSVVAYEGIVEDVTEFLRVRELLQSETAILEAIARDASLSDVMCRLAEQIERLMDDTIAAVTRLDPDTRCLHYVAAPHLPEPLRTQLDAIPIGAEAGCCGTAAYTRERVITEDIATDSRWQAHRDMALQAGLRACWSTPILSSRGEVLGTLAVYARTARAPTAWELEVIDRLVHLASIAFEQDRRTRIERERVERLQRFHSSLVYLSTHPNLTEGPVDLALRTITEIVSETLGIPRVNVWLFTPRQTALRCIEAFDHTTLCHEAGEEVHMTDCPAYIRALQTGKVIAADDVLTDHRTQELRAYWMRHRIRSSIDAPIWVRGRVIGVLCCEQTEQLREWDSDEIAFVAQIADLIAQVFLQATIQTRARRLEMLNRVFAMTAAAQPLDVMFRAILHMLDDAGESSRGVICGARVCVFHHLPESLRPLIDRCIALSQSHGITSTVVFGRPDGTIERMFVNPRFLRRALLPEFTQIHAALAAEGVAAWTWIPFRTDTHVMGGALFAIHEPYPWEEEPIELLEAFGRHMGVAIRQMQLFQRVTEQAHQLETILHNVPEGMALLDGDFRIVLANPQAASYLDLLAGPDWANGPLLRLGPLAVTDLAETESDSPWREIRLPSPQARVFEVALQPIRVTESAAWVLIIRDVTTEHAIRQRVQEQDRLAAIGQLAAGIAHDFNNLLTSIIGYAEIGLLQQPSVEIQRLLRVILQQGQQASRLVRKILDFARKSIPQKRPLELRAFLHDAIRFLRRTIPESITMEVKVDPGDYWIEADPDQIQQALMNLAINARDAMPQGGQLTFRLSRVHREDSTWIRLDVIDTGVGIPGDILPHIFEPFFTTKPRTQGTGLGLSQVYGIIRQHNGDIEVRSQPGQGTMFTIYFPEGTMPAQPPATDTPPAIPVMAKGVILLVEDSAPVREVICAMLRQLGFEVITARDGAEALERFRADADRIDLVLTDMVMPGMDGIELYRRLKTEDPHVRVVVMSGYPLHERERDLFHTGILGWIQKPVTLATLRQHLEQALQQTQDQTPQQDEQENRDDRAEVNRHRSDG